ncbi:MAG: hypothetical protein IJJ01_06075 [Firmicutes bacterium]|nr:hypothetical protein [Bacillota bacterium]
MSKPYRRFSFKNMYIIGIMLLVAVIALPAWFAYITNIDNYKLTLNAEAAEYTGEPVKPKVKLQNGPFVLEEGADFTVEYENNEEVGEATVKVTGKATYHGSSETNFSVVKAHQEIEGKTKITANIADDINVNQSADTDLTYSSSDEDVLKVDEEGNVEAIAAGEATVEVEAAETDTHEAASKEVNIEITETEAQAQIRGTLEWARKIAADDAYTYGRGQCPVCHGGNKVYDCIAFMTAAYWHGGQVDMMERWCWNHNHTSVIRQAMIDSDVWEGIGNPKEEDLQPGDVLFYYRPGDGRNGSGWFHVEIYNGDGQVVGAHTFGGKRCISVEPFNNYFRSYSDVYRYVGEGEQEEGQEQEQEQE